MSIRKLSFKEIGTLIKRSIIEFIDENSLFHGASLAYYTIFALVPLLYLALISLGEIVGHDKLIEIITLVAQENIGIKDVTWITDFFAKIDISHASLFFKGSRDCCFDFFIDSYF